MFCPNCRLESHDDTEYCSKCGVKLENKAINLKPESVQCPYCGHFSTKPECKRCGRWIDESVRPTKNAVLTRFIYAIPRELKSLKWDDTFVKTNLVIIVGIMGILIIVMLFMNYF